MSPFEVALDALFHAPGSEEALYVPLIGAALPIRAIRRQRWSDIGSVRPRPHRSGEVVEVRRSEVAQPAVGDALLIDGSLYELIASPETDPERVTWICDFPTLDRMITVLRAARADNTYGDPEDSFASLVSIPAARVDRSGSENIGEPAGGSQMQARRAATFFVAWSEQLATVTPQDRILEGDIVYDIDAIAEIGLRAGLEISASARVS